MLPTRGVYWQYDAYPNTGVVIGYIAICWDTISSVVYRDFSPQNRTPYKEHTMLYALTHDIYFFNNYKHTHKQMKQRKLPP